MATHKPVAFLLLVGGHGIEAQVLCAVQIVLIAENADGHTRTGHSRQLHSAGAGELLAKKGLRRLSDVTTLTNACHAADHSSCRNVNFFITTTTTTTPATAAGSCCGVDVLEADLELDLRIHKVSRRFSQVDCSAPMDSLSSTRTDSRKFRFFSVEPVMTSRMLPRTPETVIFDIVVFQRVLPLVSVSVVVIVYVVYVCRY